MLDGVVDPRQADTIFIATATGGVGVSLEAGKRFAPAWPADQVQTIGALAIAPDGTLYAGTGEAGPGGGSLTYGGNGVYRSRDGGRSWQLLGLKPTERIGRIVVEPKNPQGIWVAASGPAYAAGGGRGVAAVLLYHLWVLVWRKPHDVGGVAVRGFRGRRDRGMP